MMLRSAVAAVVIMLLGWGGATWYQDRVAQQTQRRLHAHISTIRTHQEGYALRNGRYVTLGDSCKPPAAGWAELDLAQPPREAGCFRAKPRFADGSTSPVGIRIVGVAPRGELTGVETDLDSKPTWSADGPP